jgi:chromosome partitioning protein
MEDLLIFSIVNEKGGVGKTTTVLSLAAAFAEKGKKVLVVDLDPQSNATMGLGIRNYELSILDVLRGDYGVDYVKQETVIEGVDCLPSISALRKADVEFSDRFVHILLKKALEPLKEYDFILIDTSPHLGLLSQSAIVAADKVLIPIEICDASIKAYGDVLHSIKNANTAGYFPQIFTVLTRVPTRSKRKSEEYMAHLDGETETTRLKSTIRETILFKDAFRASTSIFHLPRGKQSAGANDYRNLAKELLHASSPQKSLKRKAKVSSE